jgi:hypothetical protein
MWNRFQYYIRLMLINSKIYKTLIHDRKLTSGLLQEYITEGQNLPWSSAWIWQPARWQAGSVSKICLVPRRRQLMVVSLHPVSRLRPQWMHPVDQDLCASGRSRTLSMNPVATSSFQYSTRHITAGCASHDVWSYGMTYTQGWTPVCWTTCLLGESTAEHPATWTFTRKK